MKKFLNYIILVGLLMAPSSQAQYIPNGGVVARMMNDATFASNDTMNVGLATSVSGNALTVSLKQKDGTTNPTSLAPSVFSFRSSTVTSGAFSIVKATASTSIVVPASTTIGTVSAAAEYIYVYVINNAGTPELALSLSPNHDQGSLVSTTAISGGASRAILYSTTARSNVAVRLWGRFKVTTATAGTWATAPAELSIAPFDKGNIEASYFVTAATLSVSAGNQINFDGKEWDSHNAVTTGSGWKFTAPKDGTYIITLSLYSTSGNIYYKIWKNGSVYKNTIYTSGSNPESGAAMVKLLANEYIDIRPDSTASLVGGATPPLASEYISITRVGDL